MEFLLDGISMLSWKQIVMYGVGILLIWLAIKKDYEPSLLLPMGFGAILVNLPQSGVIDQLISGVGESKGIIQWLFETGIDVSEAMPILLFIGIGAMIDFGPLLANPSLFLFGAGAQFGIFAALLLAVLLGFDLKNAASIAVIGAADGPTSIMVSQILKSDYIGAIAVAAYSYMALVPLIQPMAIRLVTTKKERQIHMNYEPQNVSKTMRIAFPIIVTMIVGLVAPTSVALVGFLMFGNLIRECGVLNTMSSDHAAAWYYDFFPYASGSLCYLEYTYDYGDRAVCICDGFHRRSISCKAFESVPKRKNQSDDWGSRDFRISDVVTGHSEDGAAGGSDECSADACCRGERVRTGSIGHRRRSCDKAGDGIPVMHMGV